MNEDQTSRPNRRKFLRTTAVTAGIAVAGTARAHETNFLQAGKGAVNRTMESKLRDVVSVKDFGAVGDATADDTNAIQTALNLFTNGRSATASGSIYFPSGVYRITSPLIYGGSPQHSLTLSGSAGGARSIDNGASIYWAGNAGTSMLILNGANETFIEGINFDGASGSGIRNCIHVSADNVVTTTLSKKAAAGSNVIATPTSMENIAVGMALGVDVGGLDHEIVYVTAATETTFAATFTRSHNAGALVGGSAGSSGFKIRRSAINIPVGASSCGILFGNITASRTMQVSEASCVDCYFSGNGRPGDSFAGVRVITGGNVKNFKWDNCNFSKTRRGLSIETGSGTFRVSRPILANITECDFFQSGPGALFVDGAEAESGTAHIFYLNRSPSAMATFVGCSWQCAAPADDVIINSGGSVTLIGNELHNGRTKSSFPRIKISNLAVATGRSQLTSIGNWYQNATDTDALFYDGSGNAYKHNTVTAAFNPRLLSIGDSGGHGGPYVAITPILGYVSVPNAMLHTENCSSGITFQAVGRIGSSMNKVTVPYASIRIPAVKNDLIVFRVPPRTKIVGIIAETTVAFSGPVSALSLRVGTSVGGQELILEHDISSAAVTKGLVDEDLGERMSRAAAVQGGYIPSWSSTGGIFARFTSRGGNLSNLTAGSVSIHVIVERMP